MVIGQGPHALCHSTCLLSEIKIYATRLLSSLGPPPLTMANCDGPDIVDFTAIHASDRQPYITNVLFVHTAKNLHRNNAY